MKVRVDIDAEARGWYELRDKDGNLKQTGILESPKEKNESQPIEREVCGRPEQPAGDTETD